LKLGRNLTNESSLNLISASPFTFKQVTDSFRRLPFTSSSTCTHAPQVRNYITSAAPRCLTTSVFSSLYILVTHSTEQQYSNACDTCVYTSTHRWYSAFFWTTEYFDFGCRSNSCHKQTPPNKFLI